MVERNYQILNTLATGGTAVLYKAIQTSLGREVVIKRLHSHLTSDTNFTSRFELEAKAAASLDHENIVRIIDSGVSKDNYFIVMEHIDGLTLKEVLEQNGPLDVETTLMLAREICLGLDHAHQRGIIHRDVKPANIMITREGQVKITDFGLAKLIESHVQQTVADTLIGTPLYMSPEQAIGEGIDGRSDLFSLGTICYELTTGEQPFKGPNYAAVIQNIVGGRPVSLSKLRSDVDRQAESVIMKALSREPGKRFRTAMEMARAIEDLLGHEKISSARLRFKRLVAGETAFSTRKKSSEKVAGGKRGNSRGPIMTVAVAAVMVAVAAVYLVMDPGRLDTFRTMIRSINAGDPVPAGENRLLEAHNSGMGYAPGIMAETVPSDSSITEAAHTGSDTHSGPNSRPGSLPPSGSSSLTGSPGSEEPTANAAMLQTEERGSGQVDPSRPHDKTTTPTEAEAIAPDGREKDEGTIPDEMASSTAGGTIDTTAARSPAGNGNQQEPEPEEQLPLMGLLDIRVEPEADITIDGIYKTTGNQFGPSEIEPGLHRISCRQNDFEEYTETIRIIAGELSRRRITLRQKSGSLAFLTEAGIRVFVNGNFKGITPLSKPVVITSGKHLVELKKAGFTDWSNEVFVPADETVTLKVSLLPI